MILQTEQKTPTVHIQVVKPKPTHYAVGACLHCGRLDTWLNDIPLTAFCWGTEGSEHQEWSAVVPDPFNYALAGYNRDAIPPSISYEDRRPQHLKNSDP